MAEPILLQQSVHRATRRTCDQCGASLKASAPPWYRTCLTCWRWQVARRAALAAARCLRELRP